MTSASLPKWDTIQVGSPAAQSYLRSSFVAYEGVATRAAGLK
jgi:hypothetical protein